MTQILQEAVSEFWPKANLLGIQAVSGGSINDCWDVQTSEGRLFAKINSALRFPGMFETERLGLALLRKHSDFLIPEPMHIYTGGQDIVFLMEHVIREPATAVFWERMGRLLAQMHQVTDASFGLDHDNYIGSLTQHNRQTSQWNHFFQAQRISPLVELAMKRGYLSSQDRQLVDQLMNRLDDYFPEEPPALLHGDLWSGNAFCAADQQPSIFDPAVYYGHRFMDLGMTRLFGGFDERMYEAYQEIYPLPGHWEDRAEVANLYPLLVHVNLFGTSYVSQVRHVLKRYS